MQKLPLDSKLQDFLLTVDDRQAVLDALVKLKPALFSTQADRLTTTLREEIRTDLAVILDPILSVSNATVALNDLEESLRKLPVVHLTLAFAPTRKQLESYMRILRDSKEPRALLFDVRVDSSLLAGLQVELGGKYRDFSLKTALQSFINTPSYAQLIEKQLA